MLRDDNPLGVIVVGWAEAGPVSKVQEELLKTFADQAVIAIENVRLIDAEQQRTRELSEALQQQTATSDVLQVITSSPGELSRCSSPCWRTRHGSVTPSSAPCSFSTAMCFEPWRCTMLPLLLRGPTALLPFLVPGPGLGSTVVARHRVQVTDAHADTGLPHRSRPTAAFRHARRRPNPSPSCRCSRKTS